MNQASPGSIDGWKLEFIFLDAAYCNKVYRIWNQTKSFQTLP
jgi:hypothetical protein